MSAILALDQSAAYDMVDHEILINKMRLIGMNVNAINWMKSYLSNRRQCVEVDGF